MFMVNFQCLISKNAYSKFSMGSKTLTPSDTIPFELPFNSDSINNIHVHKNPVDMPREISKIIHKSPKNHPKIIQKPSKNHPKTIQKSSKNLKKNSPSKAGHPSKRLVQEDLALRQRLPPRRPPRRQGRAVAVGRLRRVGDGDPGGPRRQGGHQGRWSWKK